ncbi:MAG: PIN domain-containing protein [bacterium]|nr:PIN domain-containing protein [bacterium]
MIEQRYFLDTYAMIEIIGGNKSYQKYLYSGFVTSQWNLAELYYHLISTYGNDVAENYYRVYQDFVIPISTTSLKLGMYFKLKYKKERLSYIDCVGYMLAQELEIPFLTGDEKFETKENVVYVK